MGERVSGVAAETGAVWIVKIGGRACDDPAALGGLARACALVPARVVVVHGGGPEVDRLQAAFGRTPRFVGGRRVTEPRDLDLVEMALSGAMNKRVARALTAAGLRGVGIAGSDGGILRAALVPELGRVGVPESVTADAIRALLGSGFTPVLSPIGLGPDGDAVNVNADEAAAAVAAALRAERLILISDVDGVIVRGQVRPLIEAHEVELLVASGEVSAGMIPKLRAAAAASSAGVDDVWIRGVEPHDLATMTGTRVAESAAIDAHAPAIGSSTDLPAEAEVLAGVFAYPRLMLARGQGTQVWDADGRRYLDFSSGLGVAALGHGRADLAEVLREQFATLGHCSNLYGNRPVLELARRLTGSSFAKRVWFANSGTEANEAAIKFARVHGRENGGPRKHEIVAFRGGFHGRTTAALAATHHPAYRRPFAPLVPGIRFAAFNDLDQAARAIRAATCAVIVEPVQGEGGVVPAEPGFLEGLRELCDRHGALLVFDEVQCGMGRLGHLYAYEAYGVVPDMVTLAKPMAAGYPIGATLLGERVAAVLRPGQHGSTFAGGPAACALGARVFDEIARPEFLARVDAAANRLRAGLDAIAAEFTLYREARGRGLMQALVVAGGRGVKPEEVIRGARERSLLVTRAGESAVRFLPPLTVTDAEIDEALLVMRRVSEDLAPAKRRGAVARQSGMVPPPAEREVTLTQGRDPRA